MLGLGKTAAGKGYADRFWRSLDGLQLHARDYPAASGLALQPVICIHGLTRNARDFEDLAPRLAAAGRRVLALDVRGRGDSAWDPHPMNYLPAVYAADVIALMSALAISKALFIGTSMGGMITMALASMKSELVAGAVLNDIGPEVGPAGVARIMSYVGLPAEVADWRGAAAYVRARNADVFPHYDAADWAKMARRVFREDASGRPMLDYDPAIATPFKAAPVAPAASLWPLWSRLATKRPVLVIRGGASDLLTQRTVARMRKTAPKTLFAEVPDIGHAPMLDEPAALEALMAFLAARP